MGEDENRMGSAELFYGNGFTMGEWQVHLDHTHVVQYVSRHETIYTKVDSGTA